MNLLVMADIHCRWGRFQPRDMPPPEDIDAVIIAGDITNMGKPKGYRSGVSEDWAYAVVANDGVGVFDPAINPAENRTANPARDLALPAARWLLLAVCDPAAMLKIKQFSGLEYRGNGVVVRVAPAGCVAPLGCNP